MIKATYKGPAKPGDRIFKRGWTINVVGGKPPEKRPTEKPTKEGE